MKRILIIGCPGSGKSYFSRLLKEKINLPLYHLDNLHWNSDRSEVPDEIFYRELFAILNEEEWIIDGNYQSSLDLRLSYADTVIYLDYPIEICVEGVLERVGIKHDDLPWVEEKIDKEFLEYVKKFNETNTPKIKKSLEKYKKTLYTFKSRQESLDFLNSLD